GPQTGDRGAVSYAGLVLDLNDAETHGQLLDQVVLLVVEGRAAEHRDPHRPGEPVALLVRVLPGRAPGFDHPVGDHVHRLVEPELLPLRAIGAPVPNLRQPQGAGDETLRGGALGAEPAARDRAVGVALDLVDLAVADVDELPAADRAVRADGLDDVLRAFGPRAELLGLGRLNRLAAAERVAFASLPQDGPAGEQLAELHETLLSQPRVAETGRAREGGDGADGDRGAGGGAHGPGLRALGRGPLRVRAGRPSRTELPGQREHLRGV